MQTSHGKIPALSAVFTFSQTEGPGTIYAGRRVSHLVLTAYQETLSSRYASRIRNPRLNAVAWLSNNLWLTWAAT